MAYGIGALVTLALWVYCIFDIIATEEALMRNMPKIFWLIIVIFLPIIGSLAWLLLGRPPSAGFAPGDTNPRPPPRPRGPIGPEDSPDFLRNLDNRSKKLRDWEADLRRRERELREKNDEP
ncbi:MAG: PLD nuclease N-terminal domain-containing protein [Actinomycetota bacterium]|nr:PLD nuclease N-terminal domain-containing protein [Actinomycetota bacterium]